MLLKINPVELLHLQYQELDNITPETVAQAKQRLLSNADEGTISYGGRRVEIEKVEKLAQELEDPRLLRFYHKLAQYPEMNNFLAGDSYAIIEEEALQEEAIREVAAERLRDAFASLARQALETGKPTVLAAFSKQIEKGSPAFQEAVFQDAGRALLDTHLKELEQWAESLEAGPSEESLQELRGLSLLREKVPIDSLNALPQSYQHYRDAFARVMERMVGALDDEDPALAIGIVRYARRIDCKKEYADRLNKAYKQLEEKVRKKRSAAAAGSTQKWGVIGGVILLLLILVALAALLNWGYQTFTSLQ